MLGRLILLFVLVPLADLTLLMVMSAYTGWPFSIGMVIASGILGAILAKRSSRAVGDKIRQRLTQGGMTADLLTDGAMIFFAAGLLLTPGFITDVIGLTLLIPACRRWYKARVMAYAKKHFKVQIVHSSTMDGTTSSATWSNVDSDPNTIDGQVVERQEE